MNRLKSYGSAIALSIWAAYAIAENPQAPQPSPDLSLTVYAKPQRLVELRDGRKIHLFCLGEGSPTVILTAGLGDWAAVWGKVQAPIALKTRVCAWDRAGFGFSDPSSAPQDVSHTTADLEEALKRAEIDGPYVLVAEALAVRPPFAAEWRRAHDAMAALSTDGINKTVEGSSHEIKDFKRDVLISTVGEVIDKARANLRSDDSQY